MTDDLCLNTPTSSSPRKRIEWLTPFVLAGIVLVLFSPALQFEFISFDTPGQVLKNPHVSELSCENVYHIFTSRCITSYYPVRTLSFAIDGHFWGLKAFGFKLTNQLIHVANVLLLYWLIRRVLAQFTASSDTGRAWTVLAAAWAAGMYGIHPLVVEPVVWIPGREELLMTLGALAAVHCHLSARLRARSGARLRVVMFWHVATAISCLMACLSNAVGAVIPLLLLAWDICYLRDRRFVRMLSGSALPWAIALVTIGVKRLGYAEHPAFEKAASLDAVIQSFGLEPGQSLVSVSFFSWQHVGLVLRVFWLNVSSIFWPSQLTVYYDPVIPSTLLHPEVLLGGVALASFVLIGWLLRKWKGACFGMIWLGAALAPVSQIMPHHVHRADRFLYLPLIGLSIVVASLVLELGKSVNPRARKLVAAVCITVGLACMVATTDQLSRWENDFTVWRHAVQVAPRNCDAHRLLGNELAERGEFSEAFREYRRALEIDVFDVQTLDRYARYLAVVPPPDRDSPLAIRLATMACQLTSFQDKSLVRTLAIAYNSCAEEFRQRGAYSESLRCYAQASSHDPDYVVPRLNRALLLASCEEESVRDLEEAKREASLLRHRDDLTADQMRALEQVFWMVAQGLSASDERHGQGVAGKKLQANP